LCILVTNKKLQNVGIIRSLKVCNNKYCYMIINVLYTDGIDNDLSFLVIYCENWITNTIKIILLIQN